MNLFGDSSPWGRAIVLVAAAGLAASALAFVPSPLRIGEFFETVPAPAVKAPPALSLRKVAPIESYDVLTDRPVFNTDRQRDPVAVAGPGGTAGPVPAGGPGDLSQLRVVGIVGDSATQIALVRKQEGAVATVRPGDVLEGWKVDAISASGVAISSGGRKEILTIPRAQNRGQTP